MICYSPHGPKVQYVTCCEFTCCSMAGVHCPLGRGALQCDNAYKTWFASLRDKAARLLRRPICLFCKPPGISPKHRSNTSLPTRLTAIFDVLLYHQLPPDGVNIVIFIDRLDRLHVFVAAQSLLPFGGCFSGLCVFENDTCRCINPIEIISASHN